MHNARALFNTNIIAAKQAGSIYDYLALSVTSPLSFDDLLRSQVVYSVSAFDKLIHDLVRIGMVEIFTGIRTATAKYLNESISLKSHADLAVASLPPREHIFEQILFQKFKAVSFQDPEKVVSGLSYIWNEDHKWQEIAKKMGLSDSEARKTLRLIADRRNVIVHEADIDPVTSTKLNITKMECEEITVFLHRCGNEIADLVKI
ncbi:MAG: HEPN domain-containing protein [Nitrosospira sp.]|nr:HEPN domain-containing protein [Nitrosospira sp.]